MIKKFTEGFKGLWRERFRQIIHRQGTAAEVFVSVAVCAIFIAGVLCGGYGLPEESGGRELSIEEFITLVENDEFESMTGQDFLRYDNVERPYKEELESGYLTLPLRLRYQYEGDCYTAAIYYNNPEEAAKHKRFLIDSVVITRETTGEAQLLYTWEPSRFTGNNDIRTFLTTHESLEELSFSVPDGLVRGAYQVTTGDRGGVLLTGKGYPVIESDSAPDIWLAPGCAYMTDGENFSMEDDEIAIFPLWNHSSPVSEPEAVEDSLVYAAIIQWNVDRYTVPAIVEAEEAGKPIPENRQTGTYWFIYLKKSPDSDRAYVIGLDCEYFSREDALRIARSADID